MQRTRTTTGRPPVRGAARAAPALLLVLALLSLGAPAPARASQGAPGTASADPPRGSAKVPAETPQGPAAGHGGGPAVHGPAGRRPARSWPLAGRPTVVRGWEPPAGPYAPGHRGVDLAAPPGTPVRAVATGRVTFAGPVAGHGVLVVELARSGEPPLRTTYGPVRSQVRVGDEVVAGAPVAAVEAGPSHCAAGCLHWGVRRGDTYVDPLSLLPPALLKRGPSRLLPVSGVPLPEDLPAALPVDLFENLPADPPEDLPGEADPPEDLPGEAEQPVPGPTVLAAARGDGGLSRVRRAGSCRRRSRR